MFVPGGGRAATASAVRFGNVVVGVESIDPTEEEALSELLRRCVRPPGFFAVAAIIC